VALHTMPQIRTHCTVALGTVSPLIISGSWM
jgi:hypothetical protein